MAIYLINNKDHLYIDRFEKIVNIRASMNKGFKGNLIESFPNIIRVERPIVESVILNPMWLVGFVDAEGCFYVKITEKENKKAKISLVFSISQHSRDFLLMNKIIKYLNCGII